MLSAGSLDGFLTEESLALGELGVKLVIQVVAVSDDHDGGLVQDSLNQMGVEHHRERLAAALGVPEDANLTVAVGSLDGAVHSLLAAKYW